MTDRFGWYPPGTQPVPKVALKCVRCDTKTDAVSRTCGATLCVASSRTSARSTQRRVTAFAIGQAIFEDGTVQPWRDNLGHDKLVAQYRARAMVDVMITYVRDNGGFVDGPTSPIER